MSAYACPPPLHASKSTCPERLSTPMYGTPVRLRAERPALHEMDFSAHLTLAAVQ